MISIGTTGMLLLLLLVSCQVPIHMRMMMMGSRLGRLLLLLLVMAVWRMLMRMLMRMLPRMMLLLVKVIVQLIEVACVVGAIGERCSASGLRLLLMGMDWVSGEGLFDRNGWREIVVHRGEGGLASSQVDGFFRNGGGNVGVGT